MVLVKEQTYKSMEQKREPRNRYTKYSQLIFDKGAKAIEKEQSFQQIVLDPLDVHIQRSESILRTYTFHKKVNLKWIIDLNIKCNNIKFYKKTYEKV